MPSNKNTPVFDWGPTPTPAPQPSSGSGSGNRQAPVFDWNSQQTPAPRTYPVQNGHSAPQFDWNTSGPSTPRTQGPTYNAPRPQQAPPVPVWRQALNTYGWIGDRIGDFVGNQFLQGSDAMLWRNPVVSLTSRFLPHEGGNVPVWGEKMGQAAEAMRWGLRNTNNLMGGKPQKSDKDTQEWLRRGAERLKQDITGRAPGGPEPSDTDSFGQYARDMAGNFMDMPIQAVAGGNSAQVASDYRLGGRALVQSEQPELWAMAQMSNPVAGYAEYAGPALTAMKGPGWVNRAARLAGRAHQVYEWSDPLDALANVGGHVGTTVWKGAKSAFKATNDLLPSVADRLQAAGNFIWDNRMQPAQLYVGGNNAGRHPDIQSRFPDRPDPKYAGRRPRVYEEPKLSFKQFPEAAINPQGKIAELIPQEAWDVVNNPYDWARNPHQYYTNKFRPGEWVTPEMAQALNIRAHNAFYGTQDQHVDPSALAFNELEGLQQTRVPPTTPYPPQRRVAGRVPARPHTGSPMEWLLGQNQFLDQNPIIPASDPMKQWRTGGFREPPQFGQPVPDQTGWSGPAPASPPLSRGTLPLPFSPNEPMNKLLQWDNSRVAAPLTRLNQAGRELFPQGGRYEGMTPDEIAAAFRQKWGSLDEATASQGQQLTGGDTQTSLLEPATTYGTQAREPGAMQGRPIQELAEIPDAANLIRQIIELDTREGLSKAQELAFKEKIKSIQRALRKGSGMHRAYAGAQGQAPRLRGFTDMTNQLGRTDIAPEGLAGLHGRPMDAEPDAAKLRRRPSLNKLFVDMQNAMGAAGLKLPKPKQAPWETKKMAKGRSAGTEAGRRAAEEDTQFVTTDDQPFTSITNQQQVNADPFNRQAGWAVRRGDWTNQFIQLFNVIEDLLGVPANLRKTADNPEGFANPQYGELERAIRQYFEGAVHEAKFYRTLESHSHVWNSLEMLRMWYQRSGRHNKRELDTLLKKAEALYHQLDPVNFTKVGGGDRGRLWPQIEHKHPEEHLANVDQLHDEATDIYTAAGMGKEGELAPEDSIEYRRWATQEGLIDDEGKALYLDKPSYEGDTYQGRTESSDEEAGRPWYIAANDIQDFWLNATVPTRTKGGDWVDQPAFNQQLSDFLARYRDTPGRLFQAISRMDAANRTAFTNLVRRATAVLEPVLRGENNIEIQTIAEGMMSAAHVTEYTVDTNAKKLMELQEVFDRARAASGADIRDIARIEQFKHGRYAKVVKGIEVVKARAAQLVEARKFLADAIKDDMSDEAFQRLVDKSELIDAQMQQLPAQLDYLKSLEQSIQKTGEGVGLRPKAQIDLAYVLDELKNNLFEQDRADMQVPGDVDVREDLFGRERAYDRAKVLRQGLQIAYSKKVGTPEQIKAAGKLWATAKSQGQPDHIQDRLKQEFLRLNSPDPQVLESAWNALVEEQDRSFADKANRPGPTFQMPSISNLFTGGTFEGNVVPEVPLISQARYTYTNAEGKTVTVKGTVRPGRPLTKSEYRAVLKSLGVPTEVRNNLYVIPPPEGGWQYVGKKAQNAHTSVMRPKLSRLERPEVFATLNPEEQVYVKRMIARQYWNVDELQKLVGQSDDVVMEALQDTLHLGSLDKLWEQLNKQSYAEFDDARQGRTPKSYVGQKGHEWRTLHGQLLVLLNSQRATDLVRTLYASEPGSPQIISGIQALNPSTLWKKSNYTESGITNLVNMYSNDLGDTIRAMKEHNARVAFTGEGKAVAEGAIRKLNDYLWELNHARDYISKLDPPSSLKQKAGTFFDPEQDWASLMESIGYAPEKASQTELNEEVAAMSNDATLPADVPGMGPEELQGLGPAEHPAFDFPEGPTSYRYKGDFKPQDLERLSRGLGAPEPESELDRLAALYGATETTDVPADLNDVVADRPTEPSEIDFHNWLETMGLDPNNLPMPEPDLYEIFTSEVTSGEQKARMFEDEQPVPMDREEPPEFDFAAELDPDGPTMAEIEADDGGEGDLAFATGGADGAEPDADSYFDPNANMTLPHPDPLPNPNEFAAEHPDVFDLSTEWGRKNRENYYRKWDEQNRQTPAGPAVQPDAADDSPLDPATIRQEIAETDWPLFTTPEQQNRIAAIYEETPFWDDESLKYLLDAADDMGIDPPVIQKIRRYLTPEAAPLGGEQLPLDEWLDQQPDMGGGDSRSTDEGIDDLDEIGPGAGGLFGDTRPYNPSNAGGVPPPTGMYLDSATGMTLPFPDPMPENWLEANQEHFDVLQPQGRYNLRNYRAHLGLADDPLMDFLLNGPVEPTAPDPSTTGSIDEEIEFDPEDQGIGRAGQDTRSSPRNVREPTDQEIQDRINRMMDGANEITSDDDLDFGPTRERLDPDEDQETRDERLASAEHRLTDSDHFDSSLMFEVLREEFGNDASYNMRAAMLGDAIRDILDKQEYDRYGEVEAYDRDSSLLEFIMLRGSQAQQPGMRSEGLLNPPMDTGQHLPGGPSPYTLNEQPGDYATSEAGQDELFDVDSEAPVQRGPLPLNNDSTARGQIETRLLNANPEAYQGDYRKVSEHAAQLEQGNVWAYDWKVERADPDGQIWDRTFRKAREFVGDDIDLSKLLWEAMVSINPNQVPPNFDKDFHSLINPETQQWIRNKMRIISEGYPGWQIKRAALRSHPAWQEVWNSTDASRIDINELDVMVDAMLNGELDGYAMFGWAKSDPSGIFWDRFNHNNRSDILNEADTLYTGLPKVDAQYFGPNDMNPEWQQILGETAGTQYQAQLAGKEPVHRPLNSGFDMFDLGDYPNLRQMLGPEGFEQSGQAPLTPQGGRSGPEGVRRGPAMRPWSEFPEAPNMYRYNPDADQIAGQPEEPARRGRVYDEPQAEKPDPNVELAAPPAQPATAAADGNPEPVLRELRVWSINHYLDWLADTQIQGISGRVLGAPSTPVGKPWLQKSSGEWFVNYGAPGWFSGTQLEQLQPYWHEHVRQHNAAVQQRRATAQSPMLAADGTPISTPQPQSTGPTGTSPAPVPVDRGHVPPIQQNARKPNRYEGLPNAEYFAAPNDPSKPKRHPASQEWMNWFDYGDGTGPQWGMPQGNGDVVDPYGRQIYPGQNYGGGGGGVPPQGPGGPPPPPPGGPPYKKPGFFKRNWEKLAIGGALALLYGAPDIGQFLAWFGLGQEESEEKAADAFYGTYAYDDTVPLEVKQKLPITRIREIFDSAKDQATGQLLAQAEYNRVVEEVLGGAGENATENNVLGRMNGLFQQYANAQNNDDNTAANKAYRDLMTLAQQFPKEAAKLKWFGQAGVLPGMAEEFFKSNPQGTPQPSGGSGGTGGSGGRVTLPSGFQVKPGAYQGDYTYDPSTQQFYWWDMASQTYIASQDRASGGGGGNGGYSNASYARGGASGGAGNPQINDYWSPPTGDDSVHRIDPESGQWATWYNGKWQFVTEGQGAGSGGGVGTGGVSTPNLQGVPQGQGRLSPNNDPALQQLVVLTEMANQAYRAGAPDEQVSYLYNQQLQMAMQLMQDPRYEAWIAENEPNLYYKIIGAQQLQSMGIDPFGQRSSNTSYGSGGGGGGYSGGGGGYSSGSGFAQDDPRALRATFEKLSSEDRQALSRAIQGIASWDDPYIQAVLKRSGLTRDQLYAMWTQRSEYTVYPRQPQLSRVP